MLTRGLEEGAKTAPTWKLGRKRHRSATQQCTGSPVPDVPNNIKGVAYYPGEWRQSEAKRAELVYEAEKVGTVKNETVELR